MATLHRGPPDEVAHLLACDLQYSVRRRVGIQVEGRSHVLAYDRFGRGQIESQRPAEAIHVAEQNGGVGDGGAWPPRP